MYSRIEAIEMMNKWGAERRPFLFILDYENKQNILYPLNEVPQQIRYDLGARANQSNGQRVDFSFNTTPVSFDVYLTAFQKVLDELNYGNSYLVNLTFPTELFTNLRLEDIFERSSASYKLLVEDDFVVFSPECFVKIKGNKIYSYPMKGTIDARIPDAEKQILNNPKEAAEHATIVDLIRNDLNRVSENVRVDRFRYIDRIETLKGPLLQVSSEIVGDLDADFHKRLGTLIFSLLPAGSISGAPKKRTLEIINNAEITPRGFFTGVFGVYDGKGLDSAVMIRFIEKINDKLIFKSGGGITAQSDAEAEYEEMIRKVYVPFI